ncbi:hypothetical protein [Paenibacillus chibensis]|uniref:hypothetical protein n=1 Tax=Paenibacillus chibensis TaxID=59846 RepID=UPI002DB6C827|nr:hypothetical protein [Paenibacillus chibensis]MEC0371827.1 hypothetical protein [Paenibacillus chibensis]
MDASVEAKRPMTFGFGSGKGGYNSPALGENASSGRKKKTSGSGIFVGEGAAPAEGKRRKRHGGEPEAGGAPAGEEGGFRKRKKKKGAAKNGTAAFVRKKKK